ncbi:MAG: hypothetical protein DRO62_02170 [Candidatus Altiarchaeales archaeon]|nr:MAG: hypothetical protein DRO62_02170 [Candidatus Altiarchaeales archaeon]
MGIIGSRGTGNITSSRRVMDVPEKIFLLQPDAAPLVQILFKAKKKTAINPKFTWYERDLFPKRDQINDSKTHTSTETTFTVDHGSYFKAGDVIKDENTGEQMYVSSVSSNVLTVIRGWGETSASAPSDDDYLLVLGNANEEGASSPGLKSETSTEVYNYVQDFRSPFEITDILMNSELYGGGDLQNERVIKLVEHKVDIERALLFGERKEDTSTGTHPIRSTRGAVKFISTNITTATTITETTFETILESAFAYGSGTKVLFASAKLVSAINYWGRGKLKTVPKDETYGISVREYLSAHGTLLVVKHRLLANSSGANYGGYGLILDMDKLFVRVMKNLDTKLRTNLQNNDETKEKDEYRTVCGLQLNNEEAHAVIKGVTAYS